MILYSRCCGAPDRPLKSLSDTNYSDEGICPKCGEHTDFTNDAIIQELNSLRNVGGVAETIQLHISRGLSHMNIFQFIKDQCETSIEDMYRAIGKSLTHKIIE